MSSLILQIYDLEMLVHCIGKFNFFLKGGPGQKNEIEEPLSHLLLQVRCEDSCSLKIATNVQLQKLVAIAVLKPEFEMDSDQS